MRIVLITVLAIGLFGTAAWAGDPVGTYSVSGSNPGGSSYSGTATVEKTGATYKVTWEVAGTHFEGTGLALYSPEGDDWVGVWTYAGGTAVGKEKWTRR